MAVSLCGYYQWDCHFPLAFHLELKGLRVSSAGQSRVGEEGTRGSEMALAGKEDGLVCG